jgi:preprotein translocase subunit Sss1
MVKLSKTRFWDVFSTFAYILAFLITMVAVVGLAIFVMMQPQLLGLA